MLWSPRPSLWTSATFGALCLSLIGRSLCPQPGSSCTHNEDWMEKCYFLPWQFPFRAVLFSSKAKECWDSPRVWPTLLESGCLRAGAWEAGVETQPRGVWLGTPVQTAPMATSP